MPSDALTTLTHVINSPPGQLAAGGVLAGIVWKLCERVESILTEQTKLEIAVWLLGVKSSHLVSPLSKRIALAPLSLLAIMRIPTMVAVGVLWAIAVRVNIWLAHMYLGTFDVWYGALFLLDAMVGIVSIGAAMRYGLDLTLALLRREIVFKEIMQLLAIFAYTAVMPAAMLGMEEPVEIQSQRVVNGVAAIVARVPVIEFPAMLSMSLLCSFPLSVMLLKAARRFDLGFDWFNRHFDIEKKPLQSIGLVAGALVALVYWAAVIVSRVVG